MENTTTTTTPVTTITTTTTTTKKRKTTKEEASIIDSNEEEQQEVTEIIKKMKEAPKESTGPVIQVAFSDCIVGKINKKLQCIIEDKFAEEKEWKKLESETDSLKSTSPQIYKHQKELNMQVKEFVKKCEREIQEKYDKSQDLLHRPSDLPYYFISFDGDKQQQQDLKEQRLLDYHRTIFLSPMLGDSGAMKSVVEWMKKQTELVKNITIQQKIAISDYYLIGVSNNRSLYYSLSGTYDKPMMGFDGMFRENSNVCSFMPKGMMLFEGIEGNSSIIHTSLKDGTLKVGSDITLNKARSASWVPNAALYFIGLDPIVDDEFCHTKPRYSTKRINLAHQTGKYKTNGCFVIYTVKKNDNVKGLFRQTMEDAVFETAEVIIQPRVKLTVTRIEHDMEIPRSWNGARLFNVKCSVLWMDLEGI
jgi:hypothetical protein